MDDLLPSLADSISNSSAAIAAPIVGELLDEVDLDQCRLLGPFALIIQAVMGALVIGSLVIKRMRERPRRKWKIWLGDVSKQVVGQAFVHASNVAISDLIATRTSDNPCSLYALNILVDTTLGVVIIFFLLQLSTHLMQTYFQPLYQTGFYGLPFSLSLWGEQAAVYVACLAIMKIVVLVLVWIAPGLEDGMSWSLSWLQSDEAQVFVVMLVLPLVMNLFQFLMVDSFLKSKDHLATALDDTDEEAVRRGFLDDGGDGEDFDGEEALSDDEHHRSDRRDNGLVFDAHDDEDDDDVPRINGRPGTKAAERSLLDSPEQSFPSTLPLHNAPTGRSTHSYPPPLAPRAPSVLSQTPSLPPYSSAPPPPAGFPKKRNSREGREEHPVPSSFRQQPQQQAAAAEEQEDDDDGWGNEWDESDLDASSPVVEAFTAPPALSAKPPSPSPPTLSAPSFASVNSSSAPPSPRAPSPLQQPLQPIPTARAPSPAFSARPLVPAPARVVTPVSAPPPPPPVVDPGEEEELGEDDWGFGDDEPAEDEDEAEEEQEQEVGPVVEAEVPLPSPSPSPRLPTPPPRASTPPLPVEAPSPSPSSPTSARSPSPPPAISTPPPPAALPVQVDSDPFANLSLPSSPQAATSLPPPVPLVSTSPPPSASQPHATANAPEEAAEEHEDEEEEDDWGFGSSSPAAASPATLSMEEELLRSPSSAPEAVELPSAEEEEDAVVDDEEEPVEVEEELSEKPAVFLTSPASSTLPVEEEKATESLNEKVAHDEEAEEEEDDDWGFDSPSIGSADPATAADVKSAVDLLLNEKRGLGLGKVEEGELV